MITFDDFSRSKSCKKALTTPKFLFEIFKREKYVLFVAETILLFKIRSW